MKQWLLAGAMLAALAQSPAYADDVESLHILNLNFEWRRGLTLQMHTRLRTFENIGAYNQFRGGPVLLWQANPRLLVITGYYFTNQNRRVVHTNYDIHRAFGGLQYRVLRGETWSVDARGALESFHSDQFQDYRRWRTRTLLTKKLRLGEPYASGEALHERGVWYGRYTAGVLWKVNARLKIGTGYEFRQAMTGPPSHVVATLFEWQARRARTPHEN
ncbi:DUF2490 domain-containing protein [Paludibaculum fermentans]|uniref:DUF2490 domain-containing protein n=1 Tax=Paludibaculum fermentans TaxID=1473598 RepID=A0A7S7NP26_PALFE|nr:DUF2490 domain-containing protein [Paludibaculum fermentans]QOY86654.1 hypothetical protein IRI77_28265 [Paludibaculum fermentans]